MKLLIVPDYNAQPNLNTWAVSIVLQFNLSKV